MTADFAAWLATLPPEHVLAILATALGTVTLALAGPLAVLVFPEPEIDYGP